MPSGRISSMPHRLFLVDRQMIHSFNQVDTLLKYRFTCIAGLIISDQPGRPRRFRVARQLSEQRDLILLFSTPEANRYGRIDTMLLGNLNVLGFNLLLNIKAKRPYPTHSLRLRRFPSALRICGTAVQSPSTLILIALPDEPLDHTLFFPRSFLDVPGQEQPGKYNNNQKDHFASPFPNTLVYAMCRAFSPGIPICFRDCTCAQYRMLDFRSDFQTLAHSR